MADLDRPGAKSNPTGVAIQKRVVFAPGDLATIRLVCKKCGNHLASCKAGYVPQELPRLSLQLAPTN